jgi:hypothetical protein
MPYYEGQNGGLNENAAQAFGGSQPPLAQPPAAILMGDAVRPLDLLRLTDLTELEREMGLRLLESRKLLESLELAFDASVA